MKINFTKEQYETLLKMVQYGYWITSSNEVNDQSEFGEMEQYLMSFAEDFGIDGVEYDPQYNMYDLTVEREQDIHQVIDEYEEMVFRDKLAYHLARRDLAKEMTKHDYSEEDAFQRLIELEEKYHLHLEKYGLQNLGIDN